MSPSGDSFADVKRANGPFCHFNSSILTITLKSDARDSWVFFLSSPDGMFIHFRKRGRERERH